MAVDGITSDDRPRLALSNVSYSPEVLLSPLSAGRSLLVYPCPWDRDDQEISQ
jgi:hypothetical protein